MPGKPDKSIGKRVADGARKRAPKTLQGKVGAAGTAAAVVTAAAQSGGQTSSTAVSAVGISLSPAVLILLVTALAVVVLATWAD